MNEPLIIPKEISQEYGKDYTWLRERGMHYIESLSGKLWTDYNTHDPGITFLELMCYAITDLGYRMAMPVEDLLASPRNNEQEMHRQFLSALQILPNAPVTADDYRKVLVRIDGVKNVWLSAHKTSLIANYKQQQPPLLRYAIPETETALPGKELKFTLNGLYDILIEFDEFEEKEIPLVTAKKEKIIRQVKSAFHYFRNLCEDIEEVKEVPEQEVVLCADIELNPKADPESVWAEIAFAINQYLSPDINFYSLKEMQDKGKTSDEIFDGPVFDYGAIVPDTADTEPVFTRKGFVDDAEIKNSTLRNQIRLSDMIRVINKVEGVKLIRSIAFAFCSCEETDPAKVAQVFDKDVWTLCILPGHKPVLCLDNTVLNFYKDIIPIQLKEAEARQKLDELNSRRRQRLELNSITDLPMPMGQYRKIDYYTTMQNQLPETYGVGQAGLPDTVGTARKAQVKQLKAYLLFFDQVLANYFAQLAQVKTLLSADDSIAATYFSNTVQQLKDVDSILPGWRNASQKTMRKANLDNYPERKNQLLDHLLSRFNEQFGDYVFLLHRLYGNDFDYAAIRHKVDFYNDYHQVSSWRGSAYDYANNRTAAEEEINISGMEKRISRLLGFNHYKRQPIAGLPYKVFKNVPAAPLYSWSIQDPANDIVTGSGTGYNDVDAYEELGLVSIIGSNKAAYRYTVSGDRSKSAFVVVDSGSAIVGRSADSNPLAPADVPAAVFNAAANSINKIMNHTPADVVFRLSPDKKKVTFSVTNGVGGPVLGRSPSWFRVLPGEVLSGIFSEAQKAVDDVKAALQAAYVYVIADDMTSFRFFISGTNNEVLFNSEASFAIPADQLNADVLIPAGIQMDILAAYLQHDFRLEGMYVVEHILLRPERITATPGEFMPICIDPNGNYCRPLDPYSFRIDVILPGYSLRLRNKYFRQYAERIIRMETPAHILPRICFVDEAHMKEFETVYEQWRVAKRKARQLDVPMDKNVNSELIRVLENLFTIYDQGYVADCDDDTDDINPIVLGATFLGTLGGGEGNPQI